AIIPAIDPVPDRLCVLVGIQFAVQLPQLPDPVSSCPRRSLFGQGGSLQPRTAVISFHTAIGRI
ncbi:hypothetical protein BGX31_008718, partial [Mortierella sp. GBA43]